MYVHKLSENINACCRQNNISQKEEKEFQQLNRNTRFTFSKYPSPAERKLNGSSGTIS
jgi:hypothetical protein